MGWGARLIAVLGPFFGGLILEVVQYFSKLFRRNIALNLGIFSVALASFYALYVAVWASFLLLIAAMPSELSDMLRFLLPGNTYSCISAIFTTQVMIIGYQWAQKKLDWIRQNLLM